ncbi:leukotoxin LktA family filamentous adhesin [Lysobacter arvi]|uniref:Leukotoxin LktA family filamentous adhesin n=1 Tax=Lysobacter arvi TaxID=3038776 RepID=A0ABU1CCL3_9GAMM|nr:leukotoxin LktA family filamentous adhesin [Lysobacter arvi]MDR0182154.1 leukotoxin LktA family filamentous adhesin [Lysobacter arvi]
MTRNDRHTAHPSTQAATVRTLTAAIASVLGVGLPMQAWAQATNVVADGRTGTTVTGSGTLEVSTTTTRGVNAINSFQHFQVGSGDTVNLRLPGGTRNLINLVWDSQALVNGTLNSYLSNNQIGGRVFFADPHGFVLGSQGVINVGALSISTPTAGFMNSVLLDGTGDGAIARLLKGDVDLADGSVNLAGRINALDDVRVQARAIDASGVIWVEGGAGEDKLDTQIAVNTGAGTGTRLVQDGDTILLVAADSIDVSGTLRTQGGDVILQSDDAVTLAGSAHLNTRQVSGAADASLDATASIGDSGAVTVAARTIDVAQGARLMAFADNGRAAGDITLAASAFDQVQTGNAEAISSISVDGTLRGRNVSVTARSEAVSGWDFDANGDVVDPVLGTGATLLGLAGNITLGYLDATSNASVDIGQHAVLRASDDLTLKAEAIDKVETSASNLGSGGPVNKYAGLASVYGAIDADASVAVASGASVRAGDALSIQARTDNLMDISAKSITTGDQPFVATIAWSDIEVDSSATVAAGADLAGQAVEISAANKNSFSTSATAMSNPTGKVGIAGAVSLQDVNATATNAASMTDIGSLLIDADSTTSRNATTASVGVASQGMAMKMYQVAGDAMDAIGGKVTGAMRDSSGNIGDQKQTTHASDSPFRLGGALAYTDAQHDATAELSDNASINASGNVTVHAGVVDGAIRTHANSAVDSDTQQKNEDGSMSNVSMSAGVNWANYRHNASARVGRGASIDAARIAVGSETRVPVNITWTDFSSLDQILGKLNSTLGVADEVLTSYTSAKSKAGDLAIGGAINYHQVTNNSTAWIDDDARLTARADGDDAWSTALASGRTANWAQSIDIAAVNEVSAVHVAGSIGLPIPVVAVESGQDGAAVGGAFTDTIYTGRTIAGIAAGANVATADGLSVRAESRDHIVTVAPVAGKGASIGVNGTVAIVDVDNATHASISHKATVAADAVDLSAQEDLFVWSVAGALTMANSVSVGLSVGINNLDADTRAFIGDNSGDDADGITSAATGGEVATYDLDVDALTRGQAGALTVAGSYTSSSPPNSPPGFIDRLKTSVNGKIDGLRGKAADKFTNLPLLNKVADSVRGKQDQPPATEKAQPKFGIGISGSASVNMAQLGSRAYLDGANVVGRDGATQDTSLQATNSAELVSASGAAAIVRAQAPSSKFNAAMAGAVAYSLIDNATEATATNSTIANAGDLTLRALSAGEQTGIGISVGVEASGGQSASASVTGSFSIGQSSNTTRAGLDDTTVTGTGAGDVEITAYDRTRIGLGGGALYVNTTSSSSNANIGAAFTYAETDENTHAFVKGGSLTSFDAIQVRAIDSALIGTAAAMGGGGSQANGLAGAFVWNDIGNITRATITDGAVLRTTGGDGIAVSARASAPIGQLDALIDGGISDRSGYDFGGNALYDNAGETGLPGTSIVSVAGLVQVGKNNIGLSFVGSDVHNTHEVEIDSATLDADGGTLDLHASDDTRIVSLSVGVGVATGKFAGIGNATANQIANTDRVLIHDSTLTGASLSAKAEDASRIDSLAGNVSYSANTAVGAAVTYNSVANTVQAHAEGSTFDIDGTADLGAVNRAEVMAGAVAGAASQSVAITGSFSWTESDSEVDATVEGSNVTAGDLTVSAENAADLKTLAGSVAISKQAAIGAAFNVVDVSDTTTARILDSGLAVDDAVRVAAKGTGEVYSLAVAGAMSQNFAVGGSNTDNFIDNTVTAEADDVRGTGANAAASARTLDVEATNTLAAHSLAGAVAAAKSVAIGGAVGVNMIEGGTRAVLTDSVLAVTDRVGVNADSEATIETIAVAGGGAQVVGFAGSASTNTIDSVVEAGIANTSLAQAGNATTITAHDASQIDSLAGAIGVAQNAGIGAAVAVNRVGTDVTAYLDGGADNRQYHAGDVTVSARGTNRNADDSANIRTIAIGVGGGVDVGGAASVAVNLIDGDIAARIGNGANVLAENNVAVLAENRQGIDVFAGSAGISLMRAGIGLGAVVNEITGDTSALITGSTTQVSALAKGDGRTVSNGSLADPDAVNALDLENVEDYVAPNLGFGTTTVNGVAVNAASAQHVTSLGASLALSFNPKGSFALAAITGTNVLGGTTTAGIDGARINQAAGAAADQNVDVRAGSHVMSANFIFGAAGGTTDVGATAAIASTVFDQGTSAYLRNATVDAAQDVNVSAEASQNSMAIAAGVAGAIVGGAASGAINLFDADTGAYVEGGSIDARNLDVAALDTTNVNLISGSGAGGAVGVAGSFLVNVGQTTTKAWVGDADSATALDLTGDASIAATTRNDMQGIAVSGAVGGAAGVAGMAIVNVVQNDTQAWLQNATADIGGALDVTAKEELDLRAYSGALGVGLGGYGVGAAANIAVLGSNVSAAVVDSDVDVAGAMRVEADSDRTLDAITITAGVGQTAGIGGAASLVMIGDGERGDADNELDAGGDGTVSRLDDLANLGRVDSALVGDALSESERQRINTRSSYGLKDAVGGGHDGVYASVHGGRIDAASLSVNADSTVHAENRVGALGASLGVGIGGSFGYTALYGTTKAEIAGATVASDRIDVTASAGNGNGPAAMTESYVGGIGLVGLGAGVAITRVDQLVAAGAGGTFTGSGGHLNVQASDDSEAQAHAYGGSAGGAAVGVVVADAAKASQVNASLAGSSRVSGFDTLTVDAQSRGRVEAEGIGASGGLAFAANGVGVTARDGSRVRAGIGDDAVVAVNQALNVTASARPQAYADALGVSVGGLAGLGASVAIARADVDVAAHVGEGASLTADSVNVDASASPDGSDPGAHAKAVAGTGGTLLGATASVAEAHGDSKVSATTGRDVTILTGDLDIAASNTTSQNADSLGVAVGVLAVGASIAKATSNTQTTATLGENARVRDVQRDANGNIVTSNGNPVYAYAGDVTVSATGLDRNRANATAGSGGVVSGAAAEATTSADATVEAAIAADAVVNAARIEVNADHDSRYAGLADSTNAAVVGGSGAAAYNRADADVRASVGDRAKLDAIGDIAVLANNAFHSDFTQTSVSAAGGGVINGSAALIETRLGGRTRADIGDGAALLTGLGTGAQAGEVDVIASTIADTNDTASLSTGGAIDVAIVRVDVEGDFDNQVSIGEGAALDSFGYLNIGTYTQAASTGRALVNTWGLAAVGSAHSDVSFDSTQGVSVGANATLEAFKNIYLTAGRDARNLHDTRLTATSQSQGYVRGLIAIPDASASADSHSTADVTMASGSKALSASNVTAGAYTGDLRNEVDGTGHGYQLGFIPVTQHDSDSSTYGRGTLNLNGEMLAGRYNKLDIVIDAAGNLTQNAGMPVLATTGTFNPVQFLDALDCGGADSDGCKALSALRGSVYNGMTGYWQLGPLFASGGDIFLHGDAITGTGTATAKGAPSISVVNHSNRYLLLDSIETPDYSGGRVRFTGTSNTAGGLSLTQETSGAQPKVFLHNAWTGSNGPAIFMMEDVRNIGGLVHVRNDEGSIGQFGTTYAQQQLVEAPNGIVTFNDINANWFSGSNPQSDWRNVMLRPSNANDAVAYIANYVYGYANTIGLLYRPDPDPNFAGQSIVLWGGCKPHTSNDGCGVGPYGTVDFHGRAMPILPGRTLSQTLGYESSGAATNAANSSFRGQQIYVRAAYIDINSEINAGAGTNWSLRIDASASGWMSGIDAAGGTGLYEIPDAMLATMGADSNKIQAWYDATNKRILVDDVNASGGGYVYLDGRIVSSTPHGKIKVNSGYGDVRIDSQVALPVTVQDINVGNGAVGVIEIVDRQKAVQNGRPYTTWYVSRQGQDAVAYDNRNGATSYDTAFQLGDATGYDPTAGMRYRWQEVAYVGREDRGNNWYWTDAYGGGIDDGQQWRTQNAGFYQGTAGGPAFEQTITGELGANYVHWVSYGCDKDGDCNFGFPTPPNGMHWDDERGEDGGYETWWHYVMPTWGRISLNASVKADNRIAIDFSGNTKANIDVAARGDLYLDGRISNQFGDTRLAASGQGGASGAGDIVRAGDTSEILARDLRLEATGGIGVHDVVNPLQVTLTDGGSLTATSGNRGVNLDIASDAKVHITAGNATVGYGDVNVIANGDLSGIAGQNRDVVGRDITLRSRYGDIGSLAAPLNLEAHETKLYDGGTSGGVVNASAMGDIALRDHAGDFWIGSIASEAGDVRLEAPNGALLDASLRTAADTLTPEQAEAIWNDLKLDGSGRDDSVRAYENQVTARYAEYWRLLGMGDVVDGQFVLDDARVALFRPQAEAAAGRAGLTDAEVRAYVASRYDSIALLFEQAYGGGWAQRAEFQSQAANYAYTVDTTSQLYTDLTRNAVWTQEQLRYAINANALQPSGGAVGETDPNVSGRNVQLDARDVGRLASDLDVAYADLASGNVNVEQALALALANAPGDVSLVAPDGHVLTREELLALDEDDIRNGAIATVRVKRTSPLFVEVAGSLSVDATGNAFVQANGDVRVDRIDAGGSVRLAAGGSIASAKTDGTAAIVTGQDLILLAGNGSIGQAANGVDAASPLVVDIGGRLLSASAGQDALLRQINGDFTVGSVFAGGAVDLDARDGSLLSYLDVIAVEGRDVRLSAQGDIGGRRGAGATGIDSPMRVRSLGQLDGTAGGDAWIVSDLDLAIGGFDAQGDLTVTGAGALAAQRLSAGGALAASAGGDADIGDAQAGADLALNAVGDLRIGTAANAGGALAVQAGGAIAVGDDAQLSGDGVVLDGASIALGARSTLDSRAAATLDADGAIAMGEDSRIDAAGAFVLDAASFDMGAGSTVAAGDTLRVHTAGDMTLGQLHHASALGGPQFELVAGGRVLANGDGRANLLTDNLAPITIEAGQGIGSAAHYLTVDAPQLTRATATQGDVYLRMLRSVSGEAIRAGQGNVTVDAAGDVTYGGVLAAGDLSVDAQGTIDIDDAIAGGSARFDAASALTLGSVGAGGALVADAQGALAIDDARAGGDAALTAGSTMTLGNVAAGGDLSATAQQTVSFAALSSGGDTTVRSAAGDVLGGDVAAGGDVRVNAARNIAVGQVEAGQLVAMDAGESLDVAAIRAVTGIDLAAGNTLAFGNVDTRGHLGLRSRRGDVLGGSMAIGGNAAIQAAGDVRLAGYAVGGTVAIASGGDTTIGNGRSGGLQTLLSGGSLAFDALHSDTSLWGEASGGSVSGGTVDAPRAEFAARDAISLDLARVDDRLNLAAGDVLASVEQTGQGPLSMVVTGWRGGMARRVVLDVDARDMWLLERLSAMQAELDTTARAVSIVDGEIGDTMRLATPFASVWMDNARARLLAADVQLLELDKRFMLLQSGRHSYTDAYVIRFAPGYAVEVPNFEAAHQWGDVDYLGESAMRFTWRSLERALHDDTASGAESEQKEDRDDPLLPSVEGAVKLAVGP